jgi:predicted nucleic acid-binding Zn ribbon protein
VKPRGRREPQGLGTLLTGVMQDLGFGDAAAILQVAERWEAAVGPDVARHCRPSALRGGLLEASVDSSAWCQELTLRRPEILAALRRELGDRAPAELRFFVEGRARGPAGPRLR